MGTGTNTCVLKDNQDTLSENLGKPEYEERQVRDTP